MHELFLPIMVMVFTLVVMFGLIVIFGRWMAERDDLLASRDPMDAGGPKPGHAD